MKGTDEIRFDDNDYEDQDGSTNANHVLQLSSERNMMSDDSDDYLSSSDEEVKQKVKQREKKLDEKYEEWGRYGGKNKYHGTDIVTNQEGYDAGNKQWKQITKISIF